MNISFFTKQKFLILVTLTGLYSLQGAHSPHLIQYPCPVADSQIIPFNNYGFVTLPDSTIININLGLPSIYTTVMAAPDLGTIGKSIKAKNCFGFSFQSGRGYPVNGPLNALNESTLSPAEIETLKIYGYGIDHMNAAYVITATQFALNISSRFKVPLNRLQDTIISPDITGAFLAHSSGIPVAFASAIRQPLLFTQPTSHHGSSAEINGKKNTKKLPQLPTDSLVPSSTAVQPNSVDPKEFAALKEQLAVLQEMLKKALDRNLTKETSEEKSPQSSKELEPEKFFKSEQELGTQQQAKVAEGRKNIQSLLTHLPTPYSQVGTQTPAITAQKKNGIEIATDKESHSVAVKESQKSTQGPESLQQEVSGSPAETMTPQILASENLSTKKISPQKEAGPIEGLEKATEKQEITPQEKIERAAKKRERERLRKEEKAAKEAAEKEDARKADDFAKRSEKISAEKGTNSKALFQALTLQESLPDSELNKKRAEEAAQKQREIDTKKERQKTELKKEQEEKEPLDNPVKKTKNKKKTKVSSDDKVIQAAIETAERERSARENTNLPTYTVSPEKLPCLKEIKRRKKVSEEVGELVTCGNYPRARALLDEELTKGDMTILPLFIQCYKHDRELKDSIPSVLDQYRHQWEALAKSPYQRSREAYLMLAEEDFLNEIPKTKINLEKFKSLSEFLEKNGKVNVVNLGRLVFLETERSDEHQKNLCRIKEKHAGPCSHTEKLLLLQKMTAPKAKEAELYLLGLGVPRNREMCESLLTKAFNNNEPHAFNVLGKCEIEDGKVLQGIRSLKKCLTRTLEKHPGEMLTNSLDFIGWTYDTVQAALSGEKLPFIEEFDSECMTALTLCLPSFSLADQEEVLITGRRDILYHLCEALSHNSDLPTSWQETLETSSDDALREKLSKKLKTYCDLYKLIEGHHKKYFHLLTP